MGWQDSRSNYSRRYIIKKQKHNLHQIYFLYCFLLLYRLGCNIDDKKGTSWCCGSNNSMELSYSYACLEVGTRIGYRLHCYSETRWANSTYCFGTCCSQQGSWFPCWSDQCHPWVWSNCRRRHCVSSSHQQSCIHRLHRSGTQNFGEFCFEQP